VIPARGPPQRPPPPAPPPPRRATAASWLCVAAPSSRAPARCSTTSTAPCSSAPTPSLWTPLTPRRRQRCSRCCCRPATSSSRVRRDATVARWRRGRARAPRRCLVPARRAARARGAHRLAAPCAAALSLHKAAPPPIQSNRQRWAVGQHLRGGDPGAAAQRARGGAGGCAGRRWASWWGREGCCLGGPPAPKRAGARGWSRRARSESCVAPSSHPPRPPSPPSPRSRPRRSPRSRAATRATPSLPPPTRARRCSRGAAAGGREGREGGAARLRPAARGGGKDAASAQDAPPLPVPPRPASPPLAGPSIIIRTNPHPAPSATPLHPAPLPATTCRGLTSSRAPR
jgi:hypothetical protein